MNPPKYKMSALARIFNPISRNTGE